MHCCINGSFPLLLIDYEDEKLYKSFSYLKVVYYAENQHKMKQKLNITIDEEKVKQIELLVASGRFRNKSHVLEYSLNKLLEVENEGNL